MADYDLAIIGGGINGVGIARDAAGRGLKVLLVEQGDLASGTSSASSKLIHGGIRYLAQGRLALVREALSERSLLLAHAPGLVQPLSCLMPAASRLELWKFAAGLALYDRLAGAHRQHLLRIDLLERARFTLEFKLSYAGFDTPEQRPNPSAHVRFYLDAQVAEVTACHRGRRIEDVLGRGAGSEAVLQHRLRMNVFLQKWLAYLEDCGHWRLGWRPVGRASDCA